MADTAIAYGELTTLEIDSAVTEVLNVDYSGFTVNTVDRTVLGDTNKKFRLGLLDPGEVTARVQLTAANLSVAVKN